MEFDPAVLADEGSKILVQEMTKTGWELVKGGFARVFGRGQAQEGTLAELEASREEVLEDEELTESVRGMWKVRLRQRLKNDPEAVAELRALLDEIAPERGNGNITNNFHGNVRDNSILIQAGRVEGGVNRHTYRGDYVDMRGAKAEGDVIGTQNNDGNRRRKS
ncbi:hypothetical protein ACFWTE_03390 [Nocardiopsis sp. NPDC058631]|uniref:hypothetical protein n=1 Tax=Nocardiopsis sp. NPDC058631 TaxID=3346566 RepID=UPI003662483B